MGGKSISFMSLCNIFKSISSFNKKRGGVYDDHDVSNKKVWPSDEDGGPWGVAEPGIDIRATNFIEGVKKRRRQAQPEQ
ncbi:hypothetical protein A2U01_0006007 [Trifolium medium]|uniref:Uncharacterized protein n=1 Tax=Trifolium medium TaxID=97028 RepID=A0A392MDD0_9FABA|nr:hypothetical protein [Trifolium medium]